MGPYFTKKLCGVFPVFRYRYSLQLKVYLLVISNTWPKVVTETFDKFRLGPAVLSAGFFVLYDPHGSKHSILGGLRFFTVSRTGNCLPFVLGTVKHNYILTINNH